VRLARLLPFASVFALLLAADVAHGDASSLVGSWNAGPMIESVAFKTWVKECGPQPTGRTLAGGPYTISLSGDELVFSGANPFRSDQCIDMTTGSRVAHSANPSTGVWSTRCETPKDDPRLTQISTSVKATGDSKISIYEKATYSWTWASGTCAADVVRTWNFTNPRAAAAAASSSAAAAASSTAPVPTATATATATPTTTTPPPTSDCASPGAAAKLEVRPKRKVMRPGETFDFKARILDDAGCEVAEKAKFSLAPNSPAAAKGLSIDPNGRVKTSDTTEPVALTLVVDGAAQQVKVQLEVVSSDRYLDVLSKEGLDQTGADDQAVSVVVSGGGGGGATVVDPRAQEEAKRKRIALLAMAGGAAALVALGAVVLFRRSKAKDDRSEEEKRRAREDAEREHARAKAAHEATVAAAQAALAQGTAKKCPTCATIFPPDAEFCPLDGARLVAAVVAPAAAPARPAPKAAAAAKPAKMCPICGEKFPVEAGFCGKDGVALVPMN
jgi:predicted nucleic acid-binding Zn ribbon protein